MHPVTDTRLLKYARVNYGPAVDTSGARPRRPMPTRMLMALACVAVAGWIFV